MAALSSAAKIKDQSRGESPQKKAVCMLSLGNMYKYQGPHDVKAHLSPEATPLK